VLRFEPARAYYSPVRGVSVGIYYETPRPEKFGVQFAKKSFQVVSTPPRFCRQPLRIKAPALNERGSESQCVYSPEVRESAVLQFKFGNDG